MHAIQRPLGVRAKPGNRVLRPVSREAAVELQRRAEQQPGGLASPTHEEDPPIHIQDPVVTKRRPGVRQLSPLEASRSSSLWDLPLWDEGRGIEGIRLHSRLELRAIHLPVRRLGEACALERGSPKTQRDRIPLPGQTPSLEVSHRSRHRICDERLKSLRRRKVRRVAARRYSLDAESYYEDNSSKKQRLEDGGKSSRSRLSARRPKRESRCWSRKAPAPNHPSAASISNLRSEP